VATNPFNGPRRIEDEHERLRGIIVELHRLLREARELLERPIRR
jgi:hypothetical protein